MESVSHGGRTYFAARDEALSFPPDGLRLRRIPRDADGAVDGAALLEAAAAADERDPAVALFASYFGDAWADEYVHSFLFELAKANPFGDHGPYDPPACFPDEAL